MPAGRPRSLSPNDRSDAHPAALRVCHVTWRAVARTLVSRPQVMSRDRAGSGAPSHDVREAVGGSGLAYFLDGFSVFASSDD